MSLATCMGCGEDFIPGYPEQKYHSHPCFVQSLNRSRERLKEVMPNETS